MDNRKKTLIICSNPNCGKEFLRANSDIKRSIKFNRLSYCSNVCHGTINYDHLEKYYGTSNPGNTSKTDEYTGIREFIRRIKMHNISARRKKECNIDIIYLLELWNKNHVCPYTGIELTKPFYRKKTDKRTCASLDRIDSNKGYIKGNVQFVSLMANYAKNNMSHDDMINFCKTIASFWKDKLT